jgi:heptaprenyl diphosphate synthase
MSSKRITLIALYTAVALVLHVFENALPPLFSFAPGAKMGISNVVSLIAVFTLGGVDAFIILIVICLLGSLFGGNIFSLAYSLPAGTISLCIELVLIKKLVPRISIVTVSFIGAVIHNGVQLIVASIIVQTNLVSILPLMLFASVVAGIAVGLMAYFALKYLPERIYITETKKHNDNDGGN